MREFQQYPLFVIGTGGYDNYRIPALAVTNLGAVLAFCEGRSEPHDAGTIHTLVRRSEDGGRTFSPARVIVQASGFTCGNPCPVVDRRSGDILLLTTRNPADGPEPDVIAGKAKRTVWLSRSGDDGLTWSQPREITASVKRPDWTWYATGPGHGVQLASGRLIAPCDHIRGVNLRPDDPYCSHVICSDDGGATWSIGGIAGPGCNESTAVETADGAIYLNCRDWTWTPARQTARSRDGGMSFGPVEHDRSLPDPCCQGSVIRYSLASDSGRNRVLFSNSACPGPDRRNMTVRLSYDECLTWPVARTLHAGPSSYSDLAVLADGTILCFYECGFNHPCETITLARFDLEWLTGGSDSAKR